MPRASNTSKLNLSLYRLDKPLASPQGSVILFLSFAPQSFTLQNPQQWLPSHPYYRRRISSTAPQNPPKPHINYPINFSDRSRSTAVLPSFDFRRCFKHPPPNTPSDSSPSPKRRSPLRIPLRRPPGDSTLATYPEMWITSSSLGLSKNTGLWRRPRCVIICLKWNCSDFSSSSFGDFEFCSIPSFEFLISGAIWLDSLARLICLFVLNLRIDRVHLFINSSNC